MGRYRGKKPIRRIAPLPIRDKKRRAKSVARPHQPRRRVQPQQTQPQQPPPEQLRYQPLIINRNLRRLIHSLETNNGMAPARLLRLLREAYEELIYSVAPQMIGRNEGMFEVLARENPTINFFRSRIGTDMPENLVPNAWLQMVFGSVPDDERYFPALVPYKRIRTYTRMLQRMSVNSLPKIRGFEHTLGSRDVFIGEAPLAKSDLLPFLCVKILTPGVEYRVSSVPPSALTLYASISETNTNLKVPYPNKFRTLKIFRSKWMANPTLVQMKRKWVTAALVDGGGRQGIKNAMKHSINFDRRTVLTARSGDTNLYLARKASKLKNAILNSPVVKLADRHDMVITRFAWSRMKNPPARGDVRILNPLTAEDVSNNTTRRNMEIKKALQDYVNVVMNNARKLYRGINTRRDSLFQAYGDIHTMLELSIQPFVDAWKDFFEHLLEDVFCPALGLFDNIDPIGYYATALYTVPYPGFFGQDHKNTTIKKVTKSFGIGIYRQNDGISIKAGTETNAYHVSNNILYTDLQKIAETDIAVTTEPIKYWDHNQQYTTNRHTTNVSINLKDSSRPIIQQREDDDDDQIWSRAHVLAAYLVAANPRDSWSSVVIEIEFEQSVIEDAEPTGRKTKTCYDPTMLTKTIHDMLVSVSQGYYIEWGDYSAEIKGNWENPDPEDDNNNNNNNNEVQPTTPKTKFLLISNFSGVFDIPTDSINRRYYFGNDVMDTKEWIGYLKTKNSEETKQRFNLLDKFLRKKNCGIFIPKSNVTCLLESIYAQGMMEKYFVEENTKEERLAIKQTIYKNSSNLRRIVGASKDMPVLPIEETFGKLKEHNSWKNHKFYVKDFDNNDSYGKFSNGDNCVNIITIMNHACLLTQNRYEHWIDDIFNEKSDEPKKISFKPQQLYGNQYYTSAAFDIETYVKDGLQTPFMLGFKIKNKPYNLFSGSSCVEDWVAYLKTQLTNPNETLHIVAHNGGKFDFYLVLKACIDAGLSPEYTLIKSNRFYRIVFKLHFVNSTGGVSAHTIVFQDSYVFIQQSLDSACKAFETKTQKTDLRTSTIPILQNFKWSHITENNFGEYICPLASYLHNDVQSLLELFEIFGDYIQEKLNLDIRNLCSISNVAKTYFMRDFLKDTTENIWVLEDEDYNKIRKGYFGGDNRCLIPGLFRNVGYYDFNSLYPFGMLGPMPVGKPETIPVTDDLQNDDSLFGFVKIAFTHKENRQKSVFWPVRGKSGLYFPDPDAEVKTWLFTAEFHKYKSFYNYKILKFIKFEKEENLFKAFVEDLYKMKEDASKEGNMVLRTIAKQLINSSYGFWGLKHTPMLNISKDEITNPIHLEHKFKQLKHSGFFINKFSYAVRDKNYNYWLHKKYSKPKCSNVALAAAITAYSRIHLHELIIRIEKYGGVVYYCDTDSVFTNLKLEDIPEFADFFSDENPNGLGLLKNEYGKGELIDEAIFVTNKFYCLKKEGCSDKLALRGFVNKPYIKKTYNQENKEIILEEANVIGTNFLTYEDFKLIKIDGWKLQEIRDEMKSNVKSWFDDFSTVKIYKKKIRFNTENKKIEIENEEIFPITTSSLMKKNF